MREMSEEHGNKFSLMRTEVNAHDSMKGKKWWKDKAQKGNAGLLLVTTF